MKKKVTLQCSDEDSALFRQSIGAVKRINSSAAPSVQTLNKTGNHFLKREHAVHGSSSKNDHYWAPSIYETSSSLGPDESLFFVRSGVQARTIKQLRKGEYPVDQKIDLHGKTIANAYQLMTRVLIEAQKHKIRCLEIVHGKGYSSKNNLPVLKNALNQWLRRQPQVLAFCSAPRHRGGTGAIMLLIKRNKD